jgi:hypothetical protein
LLSAALTKENLHMHTASRPDAKHGHGKGNGSQEVRD